MVNKFPEIDEHFHDPNWPAFNLRIRDPEFREFAKKHPQADRKLKRYLNSLGQYYDSPDPGIEVKGSKGNTYVVKYLPKAKRFGCNCPDWRYKKSWKGKGADCKHIKQVKDRGMKKLANLYSVLRTTHNIKRYADRKVDEQLAANKRRPPIPRSHRLQYFLDDWVMKIASNRKMRSLAAKNLLSKLK